MNIRILQLIEGAKQAVGLTVAAAKANPNLLNGLRKALKKYGATI